MAETERIYTERCKPNNAEVIRAMSDEELAEFLDTVNSCVCSFAMGMSPCDGKDCPCWLSWLKSPAESSVFESMKRGLEQAINGETRSETLTKDGDGNV